MSDWPEHAEELARKGLEHVESRVKAFERGQINKRELWLIAEALHSVMQGLATQEATDVVYSVRQSIKGMK